MTQTNNSATLPIQTGSFIKPVLIGTGIGLFLISVFLMGVDDANPEWGKLWMIKPLIMVPFAGAVGGAVFHFLIELGSRGILNKTVAFLLGLIVFIFGLWLGSVLGLDGTLWN